MPKRIIAHTPLKFTGSVSAGSVFFTYKRAIKNGVLPMIRVRRDSFLPAIDVSGKISIVSKAD